MDILVLGGTGAMGVPLVRQLAQEADVYVTTRRNPPIATNSEHKVNYIQGNAKNIAFLKDILSQRHWNAVVDFMVWGSEFEQIAALMLDATEQYLFISSARVYAWTEDAITEETPRLLDVCKDAEYLKTNEYALAKAREEDLLLKSGKKNFTIVRPTITYNKNRLQLGVLEKENWLYRALHGRSIVFSKDIAEKVTTMTYGDDVAKGIASLVGKEEAKGEIFNITSPQSLLWSEILEVYLKILEEHLGYRPKVVMTEKSTNLQFKERIYQVIYCRYFNRSFDNSKVAHFCNPNEFKQPQEGLGDCLRAFLAAPEFGQIDWVLEAVNDRAAGEHTPLAEIESAGNKLYYIAYRHNLKFMLLSLRAVGKARSSLAKLLR